MIISIIHYLRKSEANGWVMFLETLSWTIVVLLIKYLLDGSL